jgi:putative ABC transport system permease protein
MRMLRQVFAVMLLAARSFPERIRSSLVIVVALVCVTVPPLAILALGLSLKASYLSTGAPDRVLILSQDARRQTDSHISFLWLQTIRAAPGIRQRHGAPLVDFEISTGFHPRKQAKPENGNARLRGIGPAGFVMRPELKVISGRLPRPGSHDMMVGVQAARKFAGLEMGHQIAIANVGWRVVGVFQTDNNLDGDAVADADALKAALRRRSYDVALASVESQSDLGRVQKALRTLPVTAMTEQDYYARLWQLVPKLALYTAYTFLLIIGGGALAATTQSVYAAVEARAREIVILRAIGFDGVAVSISVVLETALVACLGAVIGTGIVWLWVEDYPYNGGIEGGVFRVTVTWGLLLVALSWAVVVALAGAAMPCLKAGRGTVVEAMRDL